jgi:hypothetical protein
MTKHMTPRYAAALFAGAALFAHTATFGQASLTAQGETLLIDFFNTVPGVNNAVFGADSDMGSLAPWPGQLDLNAWDYFVDGSPAQAAGEASNFPGTLPAGNGYAEGGAFATGVNATDIDGKRCFGIQPTGGHFTSGNLTLRLVNNTGSAANQLLVAYELYILNDRDRSNSMRLMYSLNNAAGSYVDLPGSLVVSPLELEEDAEWELSQVSVAVQGVQWADGAELFLRWVGDDVDGSGQRDEFAITAIALTAQQATGPNLSASVTGLPAFSQALGDPSAAQSFTIAGSALTGEVSITVPAPFQVALDAAGPWLNNIEVDAVAGELPATSVHVRLNSAVAGSSTADLLISSSGANDLVVALSGNTISGSLPVLYINELMASNTTTITDPNGEYDDWIEIFNPGNEPVDLSGWYISDDPANITRYQFPVGGSEAIVPANGWLLVWADNQSAQGDLHTNFGLSANGEWVILTGPDGVSIVDQIEFGTQTADVSYGRQSDGGTPWVLFDMPTPGASNNVTGMAGIPVAPALHAWPVPANGPILFLDRPVTGVVYDMSGRIVAQVSRSQEVGIAQLRNGSYLLRTEEGAMLRFVKQ